jgi:beta-glucanase (GH16 family)
MFRKLASSATIAALLAGGTVLAIPAGAVAAALTVSTTATLDTTYTQVTADGDNSTKTTLATCPALCDGNAAGRRDAVLRFAVSGLPAGAVIVSAQLELYTWTALTATVNAHLATGGAGAASPGTWADHPTFGPALSSRTSLVAGFNAFPVTAAVTGNGTFTFGVTQSTVNTRTYWASRDNGTVANRPRLTITYDTPAWMPVFTDTFDGTVLDTAKWNARNSSLDFDKACIRSTNVSVGGGNLTLQAKKEDAVCAGGTTRHYTSSYVDTIGKASWTYGRFEIRAKSPTTPTTSRGLWPAFWLRPDDGGNGEIDVVELPGGSAYYDKATAAIFREYTVPTKNDIRLPLPGGAIPSDGFHTYVTEWEAGELRWYFDDVLMWSRTPATTSWYTECFNKPYNIRLNFQVGGWLGDPDASTVFPASFVVDYVKVLQRP